MDSFAPPESGPPRLEVADIVSDSLRALARNVGPVLIAGLALGGIYLLGFVTCIGTIVAIPLVMWGGYRFFLTLADGQPRPSVIWSDLPPLGPVFLRMWGWALVLAVANAPVSAVALAGQFVHRPHALEISTALVQVAGLLLGLLIVRIAFAPYLMVDRQLGLRAALRESIDLTRGSWDTLAYLVVLIALIGAPLQVLSYGVQVISHRNQENPALALQALPTLLALYAVLAVMGSAIGAFDAALYAVAYRKLSPKTA